MLACQEVIAGFLLRIFLFDEQRQSVTRMIERYDQSSPSATSVGDRRELLGTDGVEGCAGMFSFTMALGDHLVVSRMTEVTLLLIFVC